jgi:hypothetical protein
MYKTKQVVFYLFLSTILLNCNNAKDVRQFKIGESYKFNYSVSNSRTIEQIIGTLPSSGTISQSTLFFSSRRSKDHKNEAIVVQVKFDSSKETHQTIGPGKEAVEDKLTTEKFLSAFKNVAFKITYNKQELTSFEGYDLFKQKIDSIDMSWNKKWPLYPPSELLYPKLYFIAVFDKIYNVIPAEGISGNASWQGPVKLDLLADSIVVALNYTIEKITGNKIFIAAKAVFDKKLHIKDDKYIFIAGNCSNTIVLDATTGDLLSNNIQFIYEGVMKIGDVDVKQIVTDNTVITGERAMD